MRQEVPAGRVDHDDHIHHLGDPETDPDRFLSDELTLIERKGRPMKSDQTQELHAIAFVSTRKLNEWIVLLRDCLDSDARHPIKTLIAELETGQENPVRLRTPNCCDAPMIYDPRRNCFHCRECGKERTS